MSAESDKNVREILAEKGGGGFGAYKYLTAGDVGFFRFLWQELLTFCLGPLPGALGLVLRRLLYPSLFKSCGGKLVVGRNVVLRHPQKIRLGVGVVLDDNSMLDARGCHERGMQLADRVMINRGSVIQSKGGDVIIEEGATVGSESFLVSWGGLEIGTGTSIAGGVFVSAGTFKLDDFDKPFAEREPHTAGPIVIGREVWIATRAVILDGVHIGDNAVVSAGAIVRRRVKEKCVVDGNPARVVFEGR